MSRVMYVKASNALAGTNEAFVNVEFFFHPFPIGTEFRIGRVSWKTIRLQNSITRRNEVSHTSLRAAPLFFFCRGEVGWDDGEDGNMTFTRNGLAML